MKKELLFGALSIFGIVSIVNAEGGVPPAPPGVTSSSAAVSSAPAASPNAAAQSSSAAKADAVTLPSDEDNYDDDGMLLGDQDGDPGETED